MSENNLILLKLSYNDKEFHQNRFDLSILKCDQSQGFGTSANLSADGGWKFDISANNLIGLYNNGIKFNRNRSDF